jgi:hypothetical protein
VTLGANSSKLYAMGFRHSAHRSTLADATESRDWRIWSDLAAVLIRRARKLYWRVNSAKVDRSSGLVCDQSIALNGHYISQDYLEHLRRIRYKDPTTKQTLVFLTNNTALPPLTIAALYKSRWQVELFFKWIKQHLRIKKFLGNSENSVKTQIWCAVSTYVLIAIVKKELQLNASLYTLLQILSVSIFDKIEVSSALQHDRKSIDNADNDSQLNVFNF